MDNEVNYVFYDTAKQAGFKDVVTEPELRVIQISERSADSWVLVSTATGIFRHHGFFAVRPKLQEQKRKKREYLERLRNVEHADFTPLVIATTEV